MSEFVIKTEIEGLLILKRPTYSDDRGFLEKYFMQMNYKKHWDSNLNLSNGIIQSQKLVLLGQFMPKIGINLYIQ